MLQLHLVTSLQQGVIILGDVGRGKSSILSVLTSALQNLTNEKGFENFVEKIFSLANLIIFHF